MTILQTNAEARRPLADRLIDRCEIAKDGCWEWTEDITSRSYGRMSYRGKGHLAHRLAYEAFVGTIPAGLQIDHVCRNRRCIRPEHLEVVTCRENLLRGETRAAENARKTHCLRGHPLSGRNLRVRADGIRACRACHNAATRAYYARKRGEAA